MLYIIDLKNESLCNRNHILVCYSIYTFDK